MRMRQNLLGRKFGRWTVVEESIRVPGSTNARWLCRCDCGKERVVVDGPLIRGSSRSCGCLSVELSVKRSTTHGQSSGGRPTREFRIWKGIVERCKNPNSPAFSRYGGRGIGICKEWVRFEDFFRDMGKCGAGMTIERVNNDEDYGPDNCKWATRLEQSRNRSSSKRLDAFGEFKTIAEWSEDERCAVTRNVLYQRASRNWPPELAITSPNISKGYTIQGVPVKKFKQF
jgi:hypothetical protein